MLKQASALSDFPQLICHRPAVAKVSHMGLARGHLSIHSRLDPLYLPLGSEWKVVERLGHPGVDVRAI